MTNIEELVAHALIGDEAEKFLESDLGKCLFGMAQQEVMLAQEALETVDPENMLEIRRLQNRAWLGRSFEGFVRELIDRGRQATEIYQKENKHGKRTSGEIVTTKTDAIVDKCYCQKNTTQHTRQHTITVYHTLDPGL